MGVAQNQWKGQFRAKMAVNEHSFRENSAPTVDINGHDWTDMLLKKQKCICLPLFMLLLCF